LGTTRLDDAVRALDGAVLGPNELAGALGFDPIAVLTPAERAAVETVPFSNGELADARAQASSWSCVSRATRGPLYDARLAEHRRGERTQGRLVLG
jgi:hypothetical protein